MLSFSVCEVRLRRCRNRVAVFGCGLAALMALAVGAGAAGGPTVSHLARPAGLRCAGKSEPLAVVTGHPEFSWRLATTSDALHGVMQTAYRLQVTKREFTSAGEILWDSGKIESAATAGIEYAGPPLAPGRSYAWRVEVWDEKKHASGWSEAAHWIEAPVWRAKWIAAHPDDSGGENAPMPLFRRTFAI